jgi:hypothetical protein
MHARVTPARSRTKVCGPILGDIVRTGVAIVTAQFDNNESDVPLIGTSG